MVLGPSPWRVLKAGRSTKTGPLAITEMLLTTSTASHFPAVILLDLSEAFDTVKPQILLSFLRELGISGFALTS
jgi:hypothetical protein